MSLKQLTYQLCFIMLSSLQVPATIPNPGGGPDRHLLPPPNLLILHQQHLMHQAHINARRFSQGVIPPLSSSKHFTIPVMPLEFTNFPSNVTMMGSHLVPFHKPGLPPPSGLLGQPGNPSGFLPVPPGSPVQLLNSAKFTKSAKGASPGIVTGPLLLRPPPGPLADPVHHLPVNHLFVPVPVNTGDAAGTTPIGHPVPAVADILIIIDATPSFGHQDKTGTIIWNPVIVDFLTKIITTTAVSPTDNRIGVLVVGKTVEDMVPLSFDKPYLIHSLAKLRPSFQGGCTKKGILTASSLFYQYGRPNAVKRIILLTDSAMRCHYLSMPEIHRARKLGIDIIHVGFGPGAKAVPPPAAFAKSFFMVPGPNMLPNIGVSVAKRAFIAPVHGHWSPWSGWNICSAQAPCTVGYQSRFRLCDNPAPQFGGQECEGFPSETRMCFNQPCLEIKAGHWSRWSEFTQCSTLCGVGVQTRTRHCITVNGEPSNTCKGDFVETVECISKTCPVGGGWSMWSSWGHCSMSCGVGVRLRARQCDHPVSHHGGLPCKGHAIEEAVCDTGVPCPIHGGLGPWVDAGPCVGLCGIGRQKRVRTCDQPLPQFGGSPCVGEVVAWSQCETGIVCPGHGNWGPWSDFSGCSVKCGVAVTYRKRLCDNPAPSHGGLPCAGPDIMELPCDTGLPCPIHGQWSTWSEFEPCSAKCGIGLTQRVRMCNNPAPLFGGLQCLGSPVEVKECDSGIPCPVHGGWGHWTDFGICSVKCGVGVAMRTRQCDSPPPLSGGEFCVGLGVEYRECDTGLPCPVDGFWSHWLPWGLCSAACGVGVRQRHRLCNNPFPNFGGLSCFGSPFQEQPCDTGIHCPVDGGWSKWSPPLPCPVTCGVGTTKRVRECNNPSPMFGGAGCFGPDFKIIECTPGIECPVNGGWSFWTEWSGCEGICGTGFQQRVRQCNSPPPAYGGTVCVGPPVEKRPCDTGVFCPIDGGWSLWTDWSPCSERCGIGVSIRNRMCNAPVPQFVGKSCFGPPVEKRKCDTGVPCPIHGGWSMWGELSACSVRCGVGVMRRSRVCNSPAPMFGGSPCRGPALEDFPCNTMIPCPVHGNWGPWSIYSPCSSKCGVGLMVRKRMCNAPFPMHGGLPCVGPSIEELPCDTGIHCPVDGGWSSWSRFTPCNVNCGVGIIKRFRECTSPVPMYGGMNCIGFGVEKRICDTGILCPIDGNWGPWTLFTTCSAHCGNGLQMRTRHCSNPPPLNGGGFCPGPPLEERECDSGVPCPVHGGWSPWSSYGPCSAKCGTGIKQRSRDCSNPAPLFGGMVCIGPAIEEVPCDTGVFCPVNGQWTLWSTWTACSAVCGVGVSVRKRDCAEPMPLYGGLPCEGPKIEEIPCDTGIYCPIHGGWSQWGKFLPCSAKCGVGVTQRSRICNSPPPQYGGKFCLGELIQTKPCDTGIFCPIDGGYSPWAEWSLCVGDCGEGLQFRERKCDSPLPMYGGLPCKGFFKEERACDTGRICPIHGSWGQWSPFTVCSGDCGMGVQERTRLCDSPVPMYGGMTCVGTDVEVIPCDTGVFCPVPGGWSPWSLWSICSASCLTGLQFRERACTHPAPKYGGPLCVGENRQERVCNSGVPCPINGGWSFWSDWLPCNVKCGVGIHSRTRICNNPPPQFGGLPCLGSDVEETMCDTGIPCPVRGHWSFWTQWSFCTASCGVGLQQRVRECSNPAPLYGGQQCVGENEQIQECATGILCPVDGVWSPWSLWTPCSVPCGTGIQGRARACTNPPPSEGGMFCKGPAAEKIECDTGIPCPVPGNWSPWSELSNCDAICGKGFQTRTRTCSNPPPQFGGEPCIGFDVEKVPCSAALPCPVDGGWSPWSLFGPCVGKCGLGHQERTRTCSNPVPAFGGAPCLGPDVNVVDCDTGTPCPIHGGWTHWYQWSPCHADCGVGARKRRRDCSSPPPQFGGLPCKGNMIETGPCDTGIHCPVHGGWTAWSPPSHCSSSCGLGVQTRARSCTNPHPQYGGLPCVGPAKEIVECDTGIHCPIHGNWGFWSPFGPCNVKCGLGLHVRERFCDNPSPQFGGMPCIGPSIEEVKCDTKIACVPPGWSFWSPWSGCKVVCGIGEQIRVRECPVLSPADRVLLCHGPDTEVRDCDTGIPCPVHGGWTLWTDWGDCSAPCDVGLHRRYRECAAPVPAFGGHPCVGAPFGEKECKVIPCPIDGMWTAWSLWTGCSAECGVGVRSRERFCDSPPPKFGGLPCVGVPGETEECSTSIPCPVHGSWSLWTAWTECSAPCAIGTQIRSRICNSPAPLFGGMPCPGPSEEVRECDTGTPCPVDGLWGMWTSWSNCLAKCGLGEQRRRRLCDSPPPQFGGMTCKGFAEEFIQCDTGVPCPIHGHWSPWSDFGPCSVSCEMGVQIRSRVCNNPLPQFGGLPCKGPHEDTVGCDTGIHCPLHGHWGPWFSWGPCSASCGVGKRERRRLCDNPAPLLGGRPCSGPDVEIGICDTLTPCSADGNWGEWSMFTPCSAKCGVGTQERFRECNNPPPIGAGLPCVGPASEIIDCDTGIPCRVDGMWGLWSTWTQCSAKCGMGLQSRERFCDSPSPANGGAPCAGPFHEEKTCDTLIPCVLPAGWGHWSPWSVCSASCAMGVTTRFRDCIKPMPQSDTSACVGPTTESVDCDSGLPCPLNGNWGQWYEWSLCSVTCGLGLRERKRECVNPPPQYGGLPCEGPMTEVTDCDTGVPCPIHGGWSLWTPWSTCSKNCGVGLQGRSRACENPPPAFNGHPCEGPFEETMQCDTGIHCPIDGSWSPWSPFSTCSSTCGLGEHKQFRTCSEPQPQFGGLDCVGPDVEILECDSGVPCPIHGGWTLWSDWSICNAACGVGTSERFRECKHPAPMFGGLPCKGPDFEIIDCDSGVPCPVDGHWSLWSAWDMCSAACGIGRKLRFRTCDNPSPAYGGKPCLGLPEEVMECDTGLPCPVPGNWALWSQWSMCDVKCGAGFQLRIRTCSNPKPMFGGEPCIGQPKEERICDTGVPCPVHGNWSPWSEWSPCDSKCGEGFQIRVRTCTNPPPQFGGELCLGLPEEKKLCLSPLPCPIDGHWGPWLPWQQCSAICGIGRRKRIRLCDSPPPKYGGLPCPGYDMQDEVCDTGVPCIEPPGWSSWGPWSACSVSCGVGVQVRARLCDSPPPSSPDMGCVGAPDESRPCDTMTPCVVDGGWTPWTVFGPCEADCSLGAGHIVGYTSRRRFCENPPPSLGGLPCAGPAVEKIPCNDYPPCFVTEWSQWSRWSRCSAQCGPGEQERTRYCVHTEVSQPTDMCPGPTREVVPCEIVVCPEHPLNCSAECKWDNGIGYATYPGDCSKFVQCENLDGIPRVMDCSWGLLWSLDLLQCVFPINSECNICQHYPAPYRPYQISCRAFWDCTGRVPVAGCCAGNERFNPFTNQCEPDPTGICNEPCNPDIPLMGLASECLFRASPKGPEWYEQQIGGVWISRPCGAGTAYSEAQCQCIYFTDGFTGHSPECLPELHLSFDTQQADISRNPGIHMENVRYMGDGTAFFDGNAAINDNTFANVEWGRNVFVYIRFKPEGTGSMQGLVHNSGCGPSDIGPSVFIGLDRDVHTYGPDMVNLKFATVPQKKSLQYKFVNFTTPGNQMIDAWFKYSAGHFEAEVNGQTITLNIPGRDVAVARRHGALNIGGNLCKIGDVAFGGLVGFLDEVRVYKCKPAGHFDPIYPAPKSPLKMPPLPTNLALPPKPKPLLLQGPKPLPARKRK